MVLLCLMFSLPKAVAEEGNEAEGTSLGDTVKVRKNITAFTFSPVCLFNEKDPVLQVGYHADLPKDFMFSLDVGVVMEQSILGAFGMGDTKNSKYSGFTVKADVKKSLWIKTWGTSDNSERRTFFGVHLVYLSSAGDIDLSDTYATKSWMISSASTKYHQEKSKFGICAIFGQQMILKRFLFEWNAGAGGGWFNVQHTKQQGDYDHEELRDQMVKAGKYFDVDITAIAKIGYIIN
jgi:hypothetical protein